MSIRKPIKPKREEKRIITSQEYFKQYGENSKDFENFIMAKNTEELSKSAIKLIQNNDIAKVNKFVKDIMPNVNNEEMKKLMSQILNHLHNESEVEKLLKDLDSDKKELKKFALDRFDLIPVLNKKLKEKVVEKLADLYIKESLKNSEFKELVFKILTKYGVEDYEKPLKKLFLFEKEKFKNLVSLKEYLKKQRIDRVATQEEARELFKGN